MSRLAVVLAVAVLTLSCAPPEQPGFRFGGGPQLYVYHAVTPTNDLKPGEPIDVKWTSTTTREGGSASARLCAALVGPYPSVEQLKAADPTAHSCPVTVDRLMVASAAVDVDRMRDAEARTPMLLPLSAPPGFYQLITVDVSGPSDRANVVSGASVVRVVAP